jgi:hypothetical protein
VPGACIAATVTELRAAVETGTCATIMLASSGEYKLQKELVVRARVYWSVLAGM